MLCFHMAAQAVAGLEHASAQRAGHAGVLHVSRLNVLGNVVLLEGVTVYRDF